MRIGLIHDIKTQPFVKGTRWIHLEHVQLNGQIALLPFVD
jgi:hypothetical protein